MTAVVVDRVGHGVANSPLRPSRWLFSRSVDLSAFLGSALLAVGLALVGKLTGWISDETPEWTWVAGILLVDVAHVYATAFVAYFDRDEFRRRRTLYVAIPIGSFLIAAALYLRSPFVFWRTLAYLAVFHFVRQQYGWVALYRRQMRETDRAGWWIDSAAIYLATLGPLVYWHAHLPRQFWWFLTGDFVALPEAAGQAALALFWVTLGVYFIRSAIRFVKDRFWNPGKDIVVATTAACWYIGIVALNSDFAFTVTNVLIHGIPYLVLVQHRRRRQMTNRRTNSRAVRSFVVFLATVWALAYAEELLWNRTLWHEHAWLFGAGWNVGRWELVIVPLLAVPQMTHYLLDGFLWRRRSGGTPIVIESGID